MSHFVGILFSKKDSVNFDVLDRYCENIEVEPYKDRSPEELQEWAKNYIDRIKFTIDKLSNSNNTYDIKLIEDKKLVLAEYHNFESKTDVERLISNCFDLDEEGWSLSTYNPESKWDWFEEGGRWHGYLKTNSGETDSSDKKSIISIETPFCFIDLDGEWHEQASMGWWGLTSNDKDSGEWEKTFREYYESLPEDTIVTVIDFHI